MAQACNFIKKETLTQVFSCDFFVKFLLTFFITEYLWWLLCVPSKHFQSIQKILSCDKTPFWYLRFSFFLSYSFMKAIYSLRQNIWHRVKKYSKIGQFPKILSLKSFDNSLGNSCTKLVMLKIKCRFTCGDSELY